MARSVFFSFYYARDAWRVPQIVNMGALEGQAILNPQAWEAVKRRGDAAIRKWIQDQMAYKRAVVVQIGSQTASRPWVRYEIGKAWDDKRPLVGVRIHGLADKDGRISTSGANPFSLVNLQGGGTVGDFVPVYSPSGTTSRDVHASIKRNLTSWVENAYRRG